MKMKMKIKQEKKFVAVGKVIKGMEGTKREKGKREKEEKILLKVLLKREREIKSRILFTLKRI